MIDAYLKHVEERAAQGIPLPAGTLRNLQTVAERFGIPMPAAG